MGQVLQQAMLAPLARMSQQLWWQGRGTLPADLHTSAGQQRMSKSSMQHTVDQSLAKSWKSLPRLISLLLYAESRARCSSSV